jgi:hypothetical protein
VASEALFFWPRGSGRRIKLFERGGHGEVTAGPAFALGGFAQPLEKILRPSASVISTLAQLNHPVAQSIRAEAAKIRGNVFLGKKEYNDDDVIRHYAQTPGLTVSLNREISRFDLGIESMTIDNGPSGPRAHFVHPGFAGTIGMASESHGTRQFIKLYPFLLTALEAGGVVVLDELDTAIHPLLLPEILRWFHDADRNPHHAQLWMTCHNPSLLEDLIKEEILFCEKDRRGATAIFGLSDIQAVRRTDNYYRKYLAGMFGAVPHIG